MDSLFKNIASAARSATTNNLSGARRLGSAVVPESVQRRFTDFDIWLTVYAEPTQIPQVLDEIVEHVRENYPPRPSFHISASALSEFTRVFTIGGIEGYDARRFLEGVRQNITNVLRNNRRTKVKLILSCNMERPSMTGPIIRPSAFHSNTGFNLEGTDD